MRIGVTCAHWRDVGLGSESGGGETSAGGGEANAGGGGTEASCVSIPVVCVGVRADEDVM